VTAVIPTFTGLTSIYYGLFAGALGVYLVICSIAVWRMPDGDEKMIPAKKLFGYSIVYLFAIFSALLVDHYAATLATLFGGAV
jgi:protoheme IX farnesyltransferase